MPVAPPVGPPSAVPPSAVPPSAASPAAGAQWEVSTLLYQQAVFWQSQNQLDKAATSLRRLLLLQPDNVDALASLAQIDAEQGRTAEANQLSDHLKAIAPTSTRIRQVQAALNIGTIDQERLAQARSLLAQNRPADAVAAYQIAFHGDTPPASLAAEYYFAYSAQGIMAFEKAKRAMAALVALNPEDRQLQLAYARLLINRELTRTDGINRLSYLAQFPGIGLSARQAWRQALLWQGPDPLAQQELNAYLARYPSDPQLDAQQALFKQTLPDPSLQVLSDAWGYWRNHQFTQAKAAFQQTLDLDPKNVQALTALAIVAKQENQPRLAHDYLEQAIALQPENRGEILKTVGGDPNDTHYAGGYTAEDARRDAQRANVQVRAQYYEVSRLSTAGQYGRAELLLNHLLRGRVRGNVQLANLQLLDGQTALAEANFRAALQQNPRNPDALSGLARTLVQEGRAEEAKPLYAQARAIYAARGDQPAVANIDQQAAQPLARDADRATDPNEKIGLYRQAVAASPADPWLRLALARSLLAQGDHSGADTVMAPVQSGGTDADLQASIYYAEGNDDQTAAAALIDRLPPRARTGQMRDLTRTLALRRRIAVIIGSGTRQEQVAQLVAVAREPDPTGANGAAVGRALIQIGAKDQVQPVLESALDANHGGTDGQRLSYSGVMLAAGATTEAARLTDSLDTPTLNTDQQAALGRVRNGIAVVQSDRLNAQGLPATAYARLRPLLLTTPNDPSLRLALSRLYASNGKPEQALAINREVLDEQPRDLDVRLAAIDTAAAANRPALAAQLAQEGIRQFPNEPRIYLRAAAAAQANGSNFEAIDDLSAARALRQRQLQRDARE